MRYDPATSTVSELPQGQPSGTDLTGAGPSTEATYGYARSPQDALRLAAFAVASASLIAITVVLERAVLGVEEDIVELFGFLSPSVERVLHGAVEIAAGIIVITLSAMSRHNAR